MDRFITSLQKPLSWFRSAFSYPNMLKLSLQPGEEEKGLVGKLLDKLRALFRKKQAVAVKEESDKKEVTEDEGDGGKEVNCEIPFENGK